MDAFTGEIRMFGFDFPPRGWARCDGQLLPIGQNTQLYSVLQANFGGNNTNNFALPDLRGSAPMHPGAFSDVGEVGGDPAVTLLHSEIPAHTHTMQASPLRADVGIANPNASLAQADGGKPYQPTADTTLSDSALSSAGGSAPHNNMQPYLTLQFCICLQGVHP